MKHTTRELQKHKFLDANAQGINNQQTLLVIEFMLFYCRCGESKQWKKKMKKKRESGCHAPAWMKMYKMPALVLFWHITPKSSQEYWIRAIKWYLNDNASIAKKLLPLEARKDVKECINMHLTYILRTGIPLV